MPTDTPLEEVLEKVVEAISNQAPVESDKKGKEDTKCLHTFGHLAKLEKNSSIPEECLLCSKLMECMASS
jgi:hypothetical protein